MPTINFNQPVRYFPGTVPARDIEVKIYDVDTGGNGDDVIFNGSTNSSGQLVGTSSNWQDRNTIRIPLPFGGSTTQVVPDVPIFMIRLKDGDQDTGRIPFVPGAPIILPWANPERDPAILMDGETYDETDEFNDFITDIVKKFRNRNKSISFQVRAPEEMGLSALAGSDRSIERFIDRHLPKEMKRLLKSLEGPQVALAAPITGFDVLMVVAIFGGTALLTITSAAALVWVIAQLMGYDTHVKILSPTGDYPMPGFEFKFTKKPN